MWYYYIFYIVNFSYSIYRYFSIRSMIYSTYTEKRFKISLSFSCKFISNEAFTFFYAEHLLGPSDPGEKTKQFGFSITIEKQPSASTNPVTQLGGSLSTFREKFFKKTL